MYALAQGQGGGTARHDLLVQIAEPTFLVTCYAVPLDLMMALLFLDDLSVVLSDWRCMF